MRSQNNYFEVFRFVVIVVIVLVVNILFVYFLAIHVHLTLLKATIRFVGCLGWLGV